MIPERDEELKIGKIVKVSIGHSKNSIDKRMYCDILLNDGTAKINVPFRSSGIDKDTRKKHGIIFPPCIGQMVGVLFVSGHFKNPMVAFDIPFGWGEDSESEDYYDLLDNVNEGGLFHRTGSYIKYLEDGSIEIKNFNDDDKEIVSVLIDKTNGLIENKFFDGDTEKLSVVMKKDGSMKAENENGFFELKTDGQFNANDEFTVDV